MYTRATIAKKLTSYSRKFALSTIFIPLCIESHVSSTKLTCEINSVHIPTPTQKKNASTIVTRPRDAGPGIPLTTTTTTTTSGIGVVRYINLLSLAVSPGTAPSPQHLAARAKKRSTWYPCSPGTTTHHQSTHLYTNIPLLLLPYIGALVYISRARTHQPSHVSRYTWGVAAALLGVCDRRSVRSADETELLLLLLLHMMMHTHSHSLCPQSREPRAQAPLDKRSTYARARAALSVRGGGGNIRLGLRLGRGAV